MKTETTITTPGKWRVFSVTSAALLFLLALAGTARAQTTNAIYIDNFSQVGLLNGTMPDTVDTGGATWYACTNLGIGGANGGLYDLGVTNDGTQVNMMATNFLNGGGPFFGNGYLPFVPQVGHIYVLTVSIWGTAGGNEWLAAGYSIGDPTNAYWGSGTVGGAGWFLVRASPAQDHDYQCFLGPGTGSGSGNESGGLPASNTSTNVFQVVLNTTTGTAASGWTVSYYCNGTLGYTKAWGANPTINYVGIGQDAASGVFLHFSLTNITEPSTLPTISENPQNATVSVGQTATFWVNASGNPSPVYQWMTNGLTGATNAITGATGATYTTPATTPAFNGLLYRCMVGNDAGSVTSSVATLTVANTPATVFSAVKLTPGITNALTNVVVTFSKPVSAATALNAANYTLNNGATVMAVNNYGSTSNNVILITSILNTNSDYNLSVSNVQDFYGNTITGATVPVLPAGLAIYLRGDSGVVLDNSGNVCEWLDQTTNGNNAVQNILGGPTARPTPIPAAMNGEPALSFNGNTESNYLTAPTSTSLAFTNNGITIYDVVNFADFNAARQMVAKSVGVVASPYDYYANTSGQEVLGLGWEQNYTTVTSSGGAPAGSDCVVAATGTTNGGSITHYLNGVQNGSGALSAPTGIGDTGNPLYIGGRSDGAQWMNGQMAEILIFNNALSAQDMANVDNYLGQKYFSFTITTNLSASTTSSNGFAVTYAVAANQGSTHLTYQWQVNGTNIPGATGSSYITPVLGPVNSNTTYDVEVILPNGTIYYSATNTLTVLPAPPYITSVGIPIWNTNEIVVTFSDTVSPATATVATNYTLNNSASVLSAAIGDAPNKVVLATSPLTWNANIGYYSLMVQNVQDQFGDTIVPVSVPVGLYPTGTALWLEANNGVVIDNNGSYTGVSQWNDQSGNSCNLSDLEAGPPFEPLFTTDYHGNPTVQFSGTNVYVSGTFGYSTFLSSQNGGSLDYPPLEITGDMSIFAVVDYASSAGMNTNGEIVGKTGSVNKNEPAPYDYYENATPDSVFLRGNGTNNGSFTSSNGPSIGFDHIIAVTEAGSTASNFLDGATAGNEVFPSTFSEANIVDQGQPLQIGERYDGHNRLNGNLSELILIASALDSNDVASLNNYLASKYTIPTGTNAYPAITQQPVAVTNVYQYTTLTVPVGVSGNPLAMQWYSTNGPAIVGQTSATLVIPNIQATNSYYLVATNIYGGAVTSSVVVANVIPINPNPTNIVLSVANKVLNLSWPMDHTGWVLQAQTNRISVGISNNWVNVSGSGGTNQVIIPINLTNGTVFYRLMFP